jgi:hypothetical protein
MEIRLWSPVFTVCTTMLNSKNTTFYTHNELICFMVIRNMAIISLETLTGFYNWDCVRLLCGTSWTFKYDTGHSFPSQYYSTSAPYPFSSTSCSYQTDKMATLGNLSKSNAPSERGEYRIRKVLPLRRVLVACLSPWTPLFIPGQSMWDLSQAKWHWDRIFQC